MIRFSSGEPFSMPQPRSRCSPMHTHSSCPFPSQVFLKQTFTSLSYLTPSPPLDQKLPKGRNRMVLLILPSACSTVPHTEVALSKVLLNKKRQRRVYRDLFLRDFLIIKWFKIYEALLHTQSHFGFITDYRMSWLPCIATLQISVPCTRRVSPLSLEYP